MMLSLLCYNNGFKQMSKSCREYIKELKQQLSLTEKALELAIEHISVYSDSCVYCEELWRKACPCREMWGSELCYEHLKKCLIKEAKEMIKSE